MTPTEVETLLQNLDTRLLRVEQILPTLATKGDLAELRDEVTLRLEQRIEGTANQVRGEIKESATQLRGEIRASASQLRGEIRGSASQIRDEMERSSNQLRVLIEANRSDNQLLAEHVLEILRRLPGDR